MIFKVMKDNKVMFWTDDEECIPDSERQAALKKAGYKIKISGDAQCKKSKTTA